MSSGITFKSNYSLRSNGDQQGTSSTTSGKKHPNLSDFNHNHSSITNSNKTIHSKKGHRMSNDMMRRKSSFNTPTSPWDRRRSFVSDWMISNDRLKVCELKARPSFYSDTRFTNSLSSSSTSSSSSTFSSSYNQNNITNGDVKRIPSFSLSLSESQGFSWNEDAFSSNHRWSYTLLVLNNPEIEARDGDHDSDVYNVIDIIVDDDEAMVDDDEEEDDEYIFDEY